MRSLLILYSYHHHNTEKIANVFAKVLDAEIRTPMEIDPDEVQKFDLIGFGSGIYDGKHHTSLIDLAERLPEASDGRSFIFSTSFDTRIDQIHSELRGRLESKGFIVIDEFNCKGFNTNSFLKYFGGLSKGRPNAEDLGRAEEFAKGLKTKIET
ncbi:MAG: flavodoxin family protein [Methanomassiliicoccales archaeon]|jgi:flavodoxin